jgi:ParB family transcriptional regulator, chromosome partitioning protein
MANKTYVKNQLYNVNLADLQPDPEQPRKYMDPEALQELTESVRQHNVLEPILFRQDKEAGLFIVAGEMRCAAAGAAGLATVPGIFTDNANYLEISLIENILRSNLTPVEEAEAFDRLMVSNDYQQDDLVRIFSKSKTCISETLSLTKLPQTVRDECRKDPSVPKNVLIKIARKRQARTMLNEYALCREKMKPKSKVQARTTLSRMQKLFNKMDDVQTNIFQLDLQAQSPEDRETFIIALEALKDRIEIKIAEATQGTPAEENSSESRPKLA